MQSFFWNKSGRAKWWNPEPERMVFLGEFFIKLGGHRYGSKWKGLSDVPPQEDALALQKEFAQLAASGKVETFVLNPKTYEFNSISRAAWRNADAIRSRFSICQIDASDGVSAVAVGRHHGSIYVDRANAEQVLKRIDPSAALTIAGFPIDERYFSDYLRFMLHFAMTQQVDLENLPLGKLLEGNIEKAWEEWCKHDPSSQSRRNGSLSRRRLTAISMLLRGVPEDTEAALKKT